MNHDSLGPRYQRLRELGRGGMGRVFLVRDRHLEKDLALKLLDEPAVGPEELEQFQREFALLAALEHPGIARAHDFGFLDGRPFYTSEYIPGESLSGVIVRDSAELLRLAASIAEPLAFLHRSGILHLDVKPSNIIRAARAPADGGPAAVLIDFGLFRSGAPAGPVLKLKGSLPYMAPERLRGGELGPPADVYALGVTLFRLATGAFPRSPPHGTALAGGAAWAPVPSVPHELAPAIQPDLANVILRALALDPRSRYASAGDLLDALRLVAPAASPAPRAHGLAAGWTAGRAPELAQADAFLAALPGGGAPHVLLIVSTRGMGRTHFLGELKVRAQTRGLRAYLETRFPGGASPPGALLRSLGGHLEDFAGRRRWERFLLDLGRRRRTFWTGGAGEGERRLRRASEVALAASGVREPFLLAVDGLEFADEISIAMLADLARWLADQPGGGRPPLGLALAYREEGPCAALLHELSDHLLAPGRSTVITLGPLDLAATRELFGRLQGEAERAGGLAVYQATGGCPARIAELALSANGAVSGATTSTASAATKGARTPRGAAGDLLLALELLRRPAGAEELGRMLRAPRREVKQALETLRAGRLIAEVEAGVAAAGWVPEPGAPSPAPAARRRALHARIARSLLAPSRRPGARNRDLPEAARHLALAGKKREGAACAFLAARELELDARNRAALEMYRLALDLLPPLDRKRRVDAVLRAAELHATVGELAEGIRLVRGLLSQSRPLPPAARARAILRLAALHSRRGDFQRADDLFAEGFARARRGAALPREEHLFFLNEHAAMKAVIGEHAEAVRLCEQGLRLAGRARHRSLQEVALNLRATRANVALRTYDYEGARRDFQHALRIAETIGSPANQATVLNNLGVLHSQCDRYAEAIAAFTEAEKTCLRLDEGPSLASVHGNLAMVHAKVGDFAAMEHALGEGDRLVPALIGRRQELFLEHARGFCELSRGRFAAARAALERAIRLGEEVGDRHLASFDEVYLAEALIFAGAYGEASSRLASAVSADRPPRVRRMAFARRALLAAFLGRGTELRDAAAAHAGLAPVRPVPFLDAWEDLFLGWAFSIAGELDRALERLASAERFFAEKGLRPALALAAAVRAEARFLDGDLEGAQAALSEARSILPSEAAPGLAFVLERLLSARIRLETPGPAALAEGADRLAEAGAALVGNPLPEWQARIDALRAAIAGGEPELLRAVARERDELASVLPAADRPLYLRSGWWEAWAGKLLGTPAERKRARKHSVSKVAGERTGTVPLAGDPHSPAPPVRRTLVARSPGMRRLVAAMDRLRGSELPVLISGETGTGKELVARALHAESRRAAGPFQVLDCATIPGALIEAELFGARAGAFTGLEEDRPGILVAAQGGTLFVDEIGGAPVETQAKLLRVLSAGAVRPLGGDAERKIDVRFIFATAADLAAAARRGTFRADLLHRIRVVALEVPPLRERPEDLPELVATLWRAKGEPAPAFDPEALARLRELPWPGNVRELENLLERLRMESPDRLTVESLARSLAEPKTALIFPRNLLAAEKLGTLQERLERDYLVYHFRRLRGDTKALSGFLGLRLRQLYRRCRRLGIRIREERGKR